MDKRTRRYVIKVGTTGLLASAAGRTGQSPVKDTKQPSSTPVAGTPNLTEFSEDDLEQAKSLGKKVRQAVMVVRGDTGGGGTA